ncbi:1-phosphatidylinositol phosphodiesterase [Mycena albidolilacea]|uniref:1-phosphatidylinositol phosphodiesterase n=1 Tax=Mycena albidolilacea TaxID=1033008 RepID=A0AAD6ZPZ5_9AGAR|nr:1-phosphatidylinositol phosphodiesterase [Mycena albidolilacea]
MLTLPLTLVLLLAPSILADPLPRELVRRADASYRTLSTASNPDWMLKVPDATSLASISIPGTHESMALFGGDLTECQENFGASAAVLTAQLNAGIRAFDIRLRIETDNKFVVHHGAVYQNANFDDVLNTIDAFLAAHPSEALFMRVKQECTGEIGSCTDVSGQSSFIDIFDMYRDNSPAAQRRWWAPSVQRGSAAAVPNLGDIRGKIVLAVINGPQGGRTEQYGLAQFSGWNDGDSDFVQDNYNVPNTGAIATKRDQVRRFLDLTNSADQSKIYVNFGSGASLFAFPDAVAGGALGTQGVNPFLLIYLGQGTDVHAEVHRTGVLMLDFPGGGLINKILSFNANL